MGLAVFIGNLFLPILIYLIVKKHAIGKGNKQVSKISRKYSTLFEGCKSTHPLCKYMYAVITFRRMVQSLLIVFLYYYPMVQTTSVFLVVGISFFVFVASRPYTDPRNNFIEGFSEACFFVIHLVITFFAADDLSPKFSGKERIYLGWVIITSCCLVILIETVIFLKEYVDTLRVLYRRYFSRTKGLEGKDQLRKIKRIRRDKLFYSLEKTRKTNRQGNRIKSEYKQ